MKEIKITKEQAMAIVKSAALFIEVLSTNGTHMSLITEDGAGNRYRITVSKVAKPTQAPLDKTGWAQRKAQLN